MPHFTMSARTTGPPDHRTTASHPGLADRLRLVTGATLGTGFNRSRFTIAARVRGPMVPSASKPAAAWKDFNDSVVA